jgi:uncharacterized protein
VNKVLRGHHLLCVHGFRGMGYSPDFIKKMGSIVEDVRNAEKDFEIRVVAAFDDACMACPHRGQTECEANVGSNEHVLSMDWKVLNHLELVEGKGYKKSELLKITADKVAPDDLDFLCEGCSWLSYGVCKEGVGELKKSLGKLPVSND